MKHPWIELLVLLLIQVSSSVCQDLLISVGSRLQLHSRNNSTGIAEKEPYISVETDTAATIKATAVADSGVFYSSVTSDVTSIYYVPFVNNSLDTSASQLLLSPRNYSIEGLCFIQSESAIFWTESKTRAIHKALISDGSFKDDDTSVVLELGSEDLLKSLVYDDCSGRLFWTNWNFENPSIESAFVNGSGRRDVVRDSLYQPHGLAIFGNRLYFTNSKPGYTYDIESVAIDGTHRVVHLREDDQYPIQLAVTSTHIYWSDMRSKAVWYIPSDALNTDRPKLLYYGGRKLPSSVAIIHPEQSACNLPTSEEPMELVTETVIVTPPGYVDCTMYCVHGTCKVLNNIIRYCDCQLGYTGERCEVEICPEGFCLNKGTCQSNDDQPYCLCPPGFKGTRCEVNLCYQYCINGACTILQNKPRCSCNTGYSGERCEKDICTGYCFNGGECKSSGASATCICPGEFGGARCDKRICDNHCLNGGRCSVVNRTAVCQCEPGWRGNRCEKAVIDGEAICRSFCFNEGACIVMEDGGPICSCTDGFAGLRCEVSLALIRDEDPLMIPLVSCSILSFLLILVVAFMGVQIWRLHKRPRLRKHFVVGKPAAVNQKCPPADGVELELENCCNMNVCDTPCFEPKTRPANARFAKKEEKYNLLKNPNELF